jgi:chromate transporter
MDDPGVPKTGAAVTASAPAAQADLVPCTLGELLLYFLRLGAFGFGGPIALAGYMQRDLVEKRRWISKPDYVEGLALAQLAPGPLAAQLAIYLGWVRAGVWGATLVGIAFILPSFLMVLGLAALYLEFGGLPWMRGAFYGIGAAVIAIIARSAGKLVRLTVGKDWLLAAVFVINAAVTAWSESEIVWVFLLSGVVTLLLRAPPGFSPKTTALGLLAWPEILTTGLQGPADGSRLAKLSWFFTKAGAFVFGSGLAIVPFLRGGIVEEYRWLDDQQFLDAVAVAMITPGPVVITAGFIGHLVAGPVGAILAAAAVFLPCYLMVVILAPFYRYVVKNRQIKAFVSGVTAAATGAIAGAVFVLGKRAIIDPPTVLIAIGTLGVILSTRKVPEPIVILVAGVIGIILKAAALA